MESRLSNASPSQLFLVYAAYVFLIVSAVCTAIMLISLFRQGDERRKYILSKTCTCTFLIYTGILVVDVIYTTFFERYSHFTVEHTPVLSLGFIAIVFTISLFINKKRHGSRNEQ